MTVNLHIATTYVIKTRNQTDDGTLPAATRPYQSDPFTGMDDEAHVAKHRPRFGFGRLRISKANLIKLHCTMYITQHHCAGTITDFRLFVHDLENTIHSSHRIGENEVQLRETLHRCVERCQVHRHGYQLTYTQV